MKKIKKKSKIILLSIIYAILCINTVFSTAYIWKKEAKAETIEQITYQTSFNNYYPFSSAFNTDLETIPVLNILETNARVQFTGNICLTLTGNELKITFDYSNGKEILTTGFTKVSEGNGTAKINIFTTNDSIGWGYYNTTNAPTFGAGKLLISIPNTGEIFSIQGEHIYVTTSFKPTELYQSGGDVKIACAENKSVGTQIAILGMQASHKNGSNQPYRQPAMCANLYGKLINYKTNTKDLQTAYQQGVAAGEQNKQNYGQSEYNRGYTNGVASANKYTFESLITSILDVPIQTIYGLFNFELLGINLLNLFTALLTLAIIIFIIKAVI